MPEKIRSKSSPSSDDASFHTPRTSCESTPRSSNMKELDLEPRFSNLSDCHSKSNDIDSKHGKIMNTASTNSDHDVDANSKHSHDKTNGTKAKSSGNNDNNNGRSKAKAESKAHYEEEHSPNDNDISRRLVEYFVVVSSVPKAKKHKEAGNANANANSDKKSPKHTKQKNDGDPSMQRKPSRQNPHSHHSSQMAARVDARRAHLDEDWSTAGKNGSGKNSNAGGSASETTAATTSDNNKGQSTSTNNDEPRESPPLQFPSISAIAESVFGEVSPAERKSISNVQEADKILSDQCLEIGESLFSDEKSTASSSATSSSATSVLKRGFFKSVNEHKKKIQANTAKMNAMNATNLRDLGKSMESLNEKTMAKFKTMKLMAPVVKEERVDRDHPNENENENNGVIGQSSSSDSSFSLDGVTPNGENNERTSVEGSPFRPSQTPKSRNTPPVPILPTPPPPPLPLRDSPITPLPDRSFGQRGASDNIRIPPLPSRNATPRGASENISIGQGQDVRNGEYNDDIDDCVLEPVITAQYPPVDHPDQPLNPMLPQFCYPHGADVIVPMHEYKMPTVHHFVLTDAKGGKLYGTCLTVYEEFTPHSEEIEIRSGEKDDLDDSREEGQERGFVECSVNGSPRAGRTRRRSKTHKYYAPRVLCLLSTWPYLSAFRTYLTQLYRLATTTNLMTAPLERYILNICSEVPAPPPGSFEVKFSILDSNIRFWAPPADQPIPYVSLPYGVLFECLDIGNVLFAWYTLACERKILLVSSQLSLLTVCAEILISMIFPMRWSHLYIPCLPRFLTPMLDAPMPYLCGISREVFPYAVGEISDETVVVDLDRNVISMGRYTPELPLLPHRRKMKLEATLEKFAGDVFWKARGLTTAKVEEARLSGDENLLAKMLGTADAVWDEKICAIDEAFNLAHAPDSMSLMHSENVTGSQSRWDAVQEAFLRFYVSMLKDYRKFMPSMPTDKQQSTWRGPGSADDGRFLMQEFVQSQLPDFHPFLEELIGTQQFDDFVTRRMYNAGDAPDVKFFDQSIDAKRNRSKLKLKKKDTPFLHSAVARRDLKQIDAIQPNGEGLPHRSRFDSRFDFKKGLYTYPTWPESFDESLYGKPRPIPKIITAEFDRRLALTSMLRAKSGGIDQGRLSGSNNPSPEATAFVLFFVTFSNTIGKEWTSLEKEHAILGENMLDQLSDESIEDSSLISDGPWEPTVNPPWMGDKSTFHSLHTKFSPSRKPDPPEDIVHDVDPSNSNGLCAPDCANFCSDVGKAIDPCTFIGTPWAKYDRTPILNEHNLEYARSPSEEERDIEIEKAHAIAKAQIDLGFNTLKMMRMRKLPSESITYKTLIEACGRCGIAHRAQQLMEMMTQDGMALDSEVYFAFIKAFSNAENETEHPYSRATDTASDFSANKSTPSVTSSGFSFLNSSQGGIDQSTKSTMRSPSTKFMDGFQNAVSSTIATNRRAFKTAKMKRSKRLFKQHLTKKKNLCVTNAIKNHLEMGYCILEDLYHGIKIDKCDTCPKCSCVLSQDNIILGWKPCQVKDFSTACPSCKHRFVPKFSVSCNLESFEGSQGKGTPLYCDYLSPWVLLQEIRSIITTSAGGKAAKVLGVESNEIEQVGIDGIIDPKFREGNGINATVWWNMIVTFLRFKIPCIFLLQGSYKDQQLIMPTLEDT